MEGETSAITVKPIPDMNMSKLARGIPLAVACFILPSAVEAALIANGDLNTAVTQVGPAYGNSGYYLDTTTLNVLEDQSGLAGGAGAAVDTTVDAGQWLWSELSRGFAYSATGGGTGEGGAFVQSSAFNQKPRAVAHFSSDGGSTTGSQTISMDVFFDDNTALNDLSLYVELYGWNTGDVGPKLSLGGGTANDVSYNVTELGDSATVFTNQVFATGVADASWETVTLAAPDLGTDGYDYYVWRIGVVGATVGDNFGFDNLSVVPEPSSAILAGMFAFSLFVRRRRKA